MKKHILSVLALALVLGACNKQDAKSDAEALQPDQKSGRYCASDELLQQQLSADPQRAAFLQELERKTSIYRGRGAGDARLAGKLYIPVAVHVVHTNENIVTDDQIRSQIAVLNADFQKRNAELTNTSVYLAGYSFNNVANCDLEFVVTDIIRKRTTVTAFGTNDAVKKSSSGGSDAIKTTTHMNFWVCNLDGGLLGYAQFPGGALATDGVVCDLQAFGTTSTGYALYAQFNKGRTATHEVGHWLNLRHIWGDRRCGNDGVDDTPAHDASNGGCPAVNLRSQCSGKPLEQWMNYMDYTDDACMYMFTGGQKLRMDAAIDNARRTWVTSTAPTSVL